MKHLETIYYKGYGITKYNKEYRAGAYANPQFSDTNLTRLKITINKYLRS